MCFNAQAMHLNVWNAMFLHVCCERDTHPESLSGSDVQKFFTEEYYQIGTGNPVSLTGLEAQLVEMSKDPRALFGLCKATVASPPLVVYDDAVETQLEEVIRNHCSREVVRRRPHYIQSSTTTGVSRGRKWLLTLLACATAHGSR
jgi:hypothetical protein